jgi:CheY-like chemotaxis protein
MNDALNKTILIVEDEDAQRLPLVEVLLGNGFTVVEAKDGKEGLEKALNQRPDVILLDLVMPEMDGVSYMKELRGDSWGSTVSVIVLTNVSSDTDSTLQTIDQYHPSFYLSKGDMSIQDVLQKVKDVLEIPTL